jgi:hypothetical protein
MPTPPLNDSPSPTVPKAALGLEEAREQVDRILASHTLNASETLRRLLRFLADKAFSGEADQLKEYSIGLDALGKPADYDPRHDSGVRIQASRLRQKLDEYYRLEGRNDPLTIELPRGRFKIVWSARGVDLPPDSMAARAAAARPGPLTDASAESNDPAWRSLAIGLAALALVLVCTNVWSIREVFRKIAITSTIPRWEPELETLWNPFVSSPQHLMVVFSDPVFVRFQRDGRPDIFFRRRETTGWEDAVASPEFQALNRALGNPAVKPSFDYAVRSELVSTFVLGRFFASRRNDISLTRLSELSWQQFADNNVILLAPRFKIDEKQTGLPVHPAFVADKTGIRNLQPAAGEPAIYEDPQSHPDSDGETLELVSMLPGPLGRTKVASFTGSRSWGVIGAVQSLTDPAFAREMVQRLGKSSGAVPPYYQVVLRIRYRDGTPTTASYVTHRVLALAHATDSKSGP